MKDIKVNRNNSLPLRFTFTSGTTPINLTTYTLTFTVKPQFDDDLTDSSKIIQKIISTTTSPAHSDPTNGVTSFTITPSETNTVPGTYFCDVKLESATLSQYLTVAKGKFIIERPIKNV